MYYIVIAMCLSVFIGGCSKDKEPQSTQASCDEVVIQETNTSKTDYLYFMTEVLPPYNYMEDGKLTGFGVEIVHLIWQEMNIEPKKIEVLPWVQALNYIETKPNAALFTTVWTKERAAKFKFVFPFTMVGQIVLLARKDGNIKLTELTDIQKREYMVGALVDDISEKKLLKNNVPVENIEYGRDFVLLFKMLETNRIDLISIGTNPLNSTLIKAGLSMDDYEIVHEFEPTKDGIMFNSKVPDSIIASYQQALDKVRQTKEYLELLKKYDIK